MKVLFINSVYGKGSTGRIVKELAAIVQKNGCDYRIICGRKCEEINDSRVFDASIPSEIRKHALLSRIFDSNGFHSKRETKRIIDFIRKYEPSIINLHNIHGYYLNIPMFFNFLKREFKGKVVWTLHDCWAFTGHCAYYSYVKCARWKNGCYNCPQKTRYPASFLFDRSIKNFKQKKEFFSNVPNLCLVTPSTWLMNEVKESFLKQYKCFVINNGIDLSLFKEPECSTRDKYTLLSVMLGKDERKGYKDLFKIMEMLPKEYKLSIVGVDEKFPKKYGERIRFFQKTNSINELRNLYSNSGFFVNPTYEDNFPTVNLEALACGTPVITYSSGGSSEMIDETCGVSVNTGDLLGIVNAIKNYSFESKDCRLRSLKYDKFTRFEEYFKLFKELDNNI